MAWAKIPPKPQPKGEEFTIALKLREWQKPLRQHFFDGGKRAVEIAHRRAGKDRIALFIELEQALRSPREVWHCLPTYKQARKVVWDALTGDGERLIDKAFPARIVKKRTEDEMKIELINGSLWRLVGADNFDALVGANPRHVTFSEYALTSPKAYEFVRPIIAENGGTLLFITTPRGFNHAHKLYEDAKITPAWYAGFHPVSETKLIPQEVLDEERRTMPDELYRQEYECFKPDALVMCADKARRIADVSVGEVVLTHTGRFRRVDQVYAKPYCGPMLRIESYGARPIECTPEHPLYVCEPETQTYLWKRACDVVANDWLVTPRMDLGQKAIISPALAKIIAWFACEGSVSGNALTFSIGAHEPDNVSDLAAVLRSEGYEPTESKAEGVTTVQVNAVGLADFLVSQCGSLARNKRLPLALLRGNEEVVWDTLMRGDGCISTPEGQTPTYVYASVSEGLIQQVQIIGSALGYRGSYIVRDVADSVLENGHVIRGGVAYSLQMRDASRYASRFTDRTRRVKNGAIGRVFAITETHYEGQVHNLEVVGDHSYVVNARAVHNCDFSAANVGSILGSYLERAEQEVRIVNADLYDPAGAPIELFSDIGFRDAAAWWWVQPCPGGFNIIDHDESTGLDAEQWVERLRAKPWNARGQKLGAIHLPHDARAKTFRSRHTVVTVFLNSGLAQRYSVVPQTSIPDRINAARVFARVCRFSRAACAAGLHHLREWHYHFEEEHHRFSREPEHDEHSHSGDAFSYAGVVLKPYVKPKEPVVPEHGVPANYAFDLNRLFEDRDAA